ncbi:MAG: molecular chaperone DnaJ [Chloroflexota bacterium]|nr:molecular chaperone DnaJ [Chloroflexota bacterium]
MVDKRDYYDVLDVEKNASDDQIKKAFRKKAFEYHPDRNRDDGAEGKFKEVNEAYEVLSDPEKRAAYDRFGHNWSQGFGGQGFQGHGFDGFNFSGFGDIFDAFFGGATGAGRRAGPQRGNDLRYSIKISFEDAVFGCEKEIDVARTEKCSVCNGTRCEPGSQPETCPECKGTGEVRRSQRSIFGQFINVTACDRCHGEGRITTNPCQQCRGQGIERVSRKISVKIPAGVDNGTQVRLGGEGDAGKSGGSPGNLYVTLSVQKHKFLKRDGDDILYELPINFAQAALGEEIEVPTLEGDFALKVPAGCQNGRIFRLREKGVPHLRGYGRGDQLVRVHVMSPQSLDAKQKKLFKELAKTLEKPTLPQDDKGFFDKVKDAFGSGS